MTVLRAALTASRLLSEDPAWRLLRTNNAAIAVAVLSKHLGGEQRWLAAPALFEHVEEDLEELRGNGFDLPQTAQAYCTAWRNDGVLIRRTAEGSREETFELSLGALQAIRFVTELSQPRQGRHRIASCHNPGQGARAGPRNRPGQYVAAAGTA